MEFLRNTPDWLVYTLSAVLGAASLVLIAWAMLSDRSRGRRRCPKCWYDLCGSSLVCPECGTTARSESHTRRARRWWRLAALGTATLVAAGTGGVWPIVRVRGAVALLPDFVLVRLTPPADRKPIIDPVTHNWINDPIEAELARRINDRGLSPSNWSAALRKAGVLKVTQQPSADSPLVAAVEYPREWAGYSRLRFVPKAEGLREAVSDHRWYSFCSYGIEEYQRQERHQVLGTLPQETTHVEFDVYLVHIPDSDVFLRGVEVEENELSLGTWKVRVDTPNVSSQGKATGT